MIIRIIGSIKSIIRMLFYKVVFLGKLVTNNSFKYCLGSNTKISIRGRKARVFIGENFRCREFIRLKCFNGELYIGDNVYFNDMCSINCREKITIGNNCLFGESVKIYDHDHIYNTQELIKDSGFHEKAIKIGNNVWIGSNSIVLRGSTIGNNVVIAAGTIVKGNIPDNVLVYNEKKINTKKINY